MQACASTSGVRLEGNDFKENLPGQWKGFWKSEIAQISGETGLNIMKIDGDKVYLSGYSNRPRGPAETEVSGHVKNSTLFCTWQPSECKGELIMRRDDSNNLTLDGNYNCSEAAGTVKLKKIE
jgi:hypothetical protein